MSFFSDLLRAQVYGDAECRDRIDRHTVQTRAAGTTTTAGGVVPPVWLFQEFAIIAHGVRPWADTLRLIPIDSANPVLFGQQTAGAVVGAQASENTVPADGSFVAGAVSTQPKTYTGKVDVSRQLVDGSNPLIDSLIYADAMGAYNEQIENAVVVAFEALAPPVSITYPGTAPAYTNMFDALVDAGASVRKHRRLPASTVFCSDGAYAFLAKQKDTSGRPLMTTGDYGPVNAYGESGPVDYGAMHVAGEAVGLQIVPTWALANDSHLYVCRSDDYLLLESPTFNFRYEEVLGPESIRLGVWGYAAPILGRYPGSSVRIDAGALIPAPQSDLEEAKAANTGNKK